MKGHGTGARTHQNRAQRLDQAARRQREWAREVRRAQERGTEVETPALVARKAERRRRQRERQAARRAAEARGGERQQEEEEQLWQEEEEPREQQQSSDERSRSARGRSPACSLRSAAHVHRTTDATVAWRPAPEPLHLTHVVFPRGWDADGCWHTGLPVPRGMLADRCGRSPSPSEVSPASEHDPSEVSPASEHDPSEVTPASSSDLEVQVITSDNRRARWSDQPPDGRRDASDDRCDDEEEEGQEAPDDRRDVRDYLDNFEIYFYSVDKDSWSYCTSHDESYGEAVYYDVRDFRDPNADQNVRRHDGRNRHIQEGLVGAHRYKFMLLVRAVVRDVQAAIRARKRGVAVAFWCNHGKHRSVAAAELMAGVMTSKFVNVTIEHVSLDYYGSRCKCNECSRLLPQQDVLEAAWRSFDDRWWVVDLSR
jgi:hypothetical protein